MRNTRIYIVLALVLILGLSWKSIASGSTADQIDPFRGASLEVEKWNPLIARNANERGLSFVIENTTITNRDTGMFMNDNLELMLPISVLRDSFNCSARLYDGERLLVEKHANEFSFTLLDYTARINQQPAIISTPMIQVDGEFFISAEMLANFLRYSFHWDVEANQATAVDLARDENIYPAKYDLRERERAPRVKDQGRDGTCWAFAALSAMESKLLPEEEVEFSPDHMVYNNSFQLASADGGVYTMGMAYLAAWQGPVYEWQDPHNPNRDSHPPASRILAPVRHVQEMQVIEAKDFKRIKESVFKYGGVQTSIYNAFSDPRFYHAGNAAYFYLGTEMPNHDVLIIGWDDNYPKEKFSEHPQADGAFICQNSWGSSFGEGGVFYLSYLDVNVGTHNVVYTGIEGTNNYDHIYQSDLLGWVGNVGFNRDSIYGANVYTAQGPETLRAAGFYATGTDTEYKIYVVRNYEDASSLKDRALVAEGRLGNAGYYTIRFDRPVAVDAEERFAIILHISTPGSLHPLAIEYAADETTANVDLTDGEAYISSQGLSWESLENPPDGGDGSNLCLKAFSDNR